MINPHSEEITRRLCKTKEAMNPASSDPAVSQEQGGAGDGGSEAVLLDNEIQARKKACKNSLYLVVVNLFSTAMVFIFHLVSMEMLISVGLCVGLTVYLYQRKRNDPAFTGVQSMDTTLLTFAVVSPLTLTIGLAFKRREEALRSVADLRATLFQLYNAHSFWDFQQQPGNTETSGRTKSTVNWLAHSDEACTEILQINHHLARFLTLPNYTRARHRATPLGIREARRTKDVAADLHRSEIVHIARLGKLCEILKREGLPPNEATRIRQYERYVNFDVENLRNLKEYRTPQALRSFGRIFSVILPPFYAPYFADMGAQVGSLAIGVIFAALTSIALTGLFETVSQFEDPFIESSVLDGVNVVKELIDEFTPDLMALRKEYFPDAPDFKEVIGTDDVCASTLKEVSVLHPLEATRSQIRLINGDV